MKSEDSKGRDGWSLIMVGFTGRWLEFSEAARTAFGRPGLDSFSLALRAEEHLPSEIADGMSRDEAERIAVELNEVGAEIQVLPTGQVEDVRYHAAEVWPSRCVGDRCFTEIDGLVLGLSPLNARENLAHLRERNPDVSDWELECSVNHFHPGLGEPPDEEISIMVAVLDSLASDLSNAYPDLAFTVSQCPGHHQMSYWQTKSDSPRFESRWIKSSDPTGKSWCWNCGRSREFERDSHINPHFPTLEWGKCNTCGERIISRRCEKLTFVEPAAVQGDRQK